MAEKLSLKSLASLPGEVATPSYARADLSPGILHIGVGNFHRAHQALYLDDLFNAGRSRDFAIIGAGVRPHDASLRAALEPQDWLTTIVELEPETQRARVTGAMIDYIPVAEDAVTIGRALADPRIKIASLTVTEGGYCIDPASGEFNPDHPEIRADAVAPDKPRSAFGAILMGLRARREAGIQPFTVMSCDNLPGNGRVARDAVAGLAEQIDPDLAAWVRGEVAFPDSMVDRITPATGERERALLAERFGIIDGWPVFCEPFRQWVMEDRFPAGRPDLELAGVTFTDHVGAFELMKLRILNGGHAAIAYPAGLLGIHFVHDAMADPMIRAFLEKLEQDEIMPTVPPVPETDLGDYFRTIVSRFANPGVGDTIPRLCQDGSNRQPKFILATVRDRLEVAAPVTGLALESALWCRYCAATTDAGAPFTLDDPNAARIQAAALSARNEPMAFLAMDDVYGSLASEPTFARPFKAWLERLWREGTRPTLEAYLAGHVPET